VIKRILNIEMSETLLKSIYHIGEKLYNDMEEKGRRPESVQSKVDSVDTMYILADGAMVPTVSDGEVEYKENKLGMTFTDKDVVPIESKKGENRVEIKNKRFVSSIGEGVERFKKMLHALSKENGLYKADKVILLCDGASWLSKMKDEYFPRCHTNFRLVSCSRSFMADSTFVIWRG
jgi:hypothetical protein